jgi:heme oxygenase
MAKTTATAKEPLAARPAAASNAESILARLKAATRAEHDAIEATLDFLGPDLDRHAYQQRLARLFTFYEPLEPLLAGAADWAHWGIDFDARRKSAHLAADLRWLGHGPSASWPRCAALPPLSSAAAAFGCLYVLEGATLGGRIIARHLVGTLGLGADSGAGYFSAYGDRGGSMWKAFQAALTAFAEQTEDSEAIVASAVATFDALRLWCAAGDPLRSDPFRSGS